MSGLRVLHVIEAMHRGGAESMVVEHVRHAAPDVESLVVALNRGGPALEAAARAGARVHVLDKGARRTAAVRSLAALIKDQRVDIVNGHNPTGALYAAAAAGTGGPVVLRTEHSVHFRGRHSRFYPALEALATTRVHRVVCVCEAVRLSHQPRLAWAAGRFVTVLNGISTSPPARPRDEVRRELGVAPHERVALAIGSLTPHKAHGDLLEAMAVCARDVPEAGLLVAGEGPLRDSLAARAHALGIGPRVRWLGDRADVVDLLAAADLFVLPSLREGLSITLLEAMRAGRAAVLTRVGGNDEAARDGETARLVPSGAPHLLAGALSELLADPARCARLGTTARARWAQDFTAERMVAETETLYRSALGRAPRRDPGPADSRSGTGAEPGGRAE